MAIDPESPQSGHEDTDRSPRSLRMATVIVEYEGVALDFLADGPRVAHEHDGRWFVTWREGGRLSARQHVPEQLAGVERWLAVPISPTREQQIVDSHVSLREVIEFSEWVPYILEGLDPLHPQQVTPSRPQLLPRGYVPLSDVSVAGVRLGPSSTPPTGSELDVLLHFVPGEASPPRPQLADVGAVQEAVQRFVSIDALEMFRTERGTPGGFLTESWTSDWTGLDMLEATPGTMRVRASANVANGEQKAAIVSALRHLLGAVEAEGPGTVRHAEELGPISFAALSSLLSLLRSRQLSLAIRWRSGDVDECAFLGPLARVEGERLVNPLSVKQPGPFDLATVQVSISAEDYALLEKPADPERGGLQRLIVDLRGVARKEGDRYLIPLTPIDVEKVLRYVLEYGQGGYQDRLRPIYRAMYRLALSFTGLK